MSRAIDDAIRIIPPEWFRPSPALYWADLILSAAIGWGALVTAGVSVGGPRLAWLAVATIGLYRAVIFIHELTHLTPRELPGFTTAWTLLVGIPMLVPS